jgi:thiol peroxidase
MTKITLKGNTINTGGELPAVGSMAKDFKLVATDLSVKTMNDFKGKKLVLNIFPSIDTGTCAASVRNFNKRAADLDNTTVLCISRDLPFAQARFCGAEGIENVVMLSDFDTGQFARDYGLNLIDGPMKGLNSRCIVIIDEEGKITYTQQVAEISEEPDYEHAMKNL